MKNVRIEKFRTLELNERNVNTLFKRCLAEEPEISNLNLYYTSQVLKPNYTGRNSESIKFSRERINTNTRTIQYLLGQIKNFHIPAGDTGVSAIALQEGFLRYDDVIWTRDYDALFALYHLALCSASISDFVLSNSNQIIGATKSPKCTPTLSPKDPNFPAWWEEHKGEWE